MTEQEMAKRGSCGSEAFTVVLDEPKKRKGTGYVSCWRCHNVMYEIQRQSVDDWYIMDNGGGGPFTEEYKRELEATRPVE